MARLRPWLLYLMVLVFVLLSGFSIAGYFTNVHLVSVQQQSSAWSLSQLQLQLQRFCLSLQLYEAGRRDKEQLQLSYDLLWSRVDIFLQGRDSEALRRQPGVTEQITQLAALLRANADTISALPAGESTRSMVLGGVFTPFQEVINTIMVDTLTSSESLQSLRTVERAQQQLAFSLIGLVISGLLLALYLLRQYRRYTLLALHDPLTSLANRSAFQMQLQQAAHQPGDALLCLIDLNQFKEVNLTLGQAQGDAMLQRTGRRLRANLPATAVIARLESDDFAVLLTDMADQSVVLCQLQQLQQVLLFEYFLPDRVFQVRASMGLALSKGGFDADALLAQASMALDQAKRSHSRTPVLFADAMAVAVSRRRALLESISMGLMDVSISNPLRLVYQPLYALDCREMSGMEVLVRWQHPEFGAIAPLEIIELVENNGLGQTYANWLLERIRHDLHLDELPWPSHLRIAINLSPSIFTTQLPQWLDSRLAQIGLPAAQLLVEITETIAMVEFKRSQFIVNELHKLGITVALDDFGTGYSSLSYLRELQVDKLKIDKSFIRQLHADRKQRMFVRHIVRLSHYLDVSVVAEGIETEAEERMAHKLGCDEGQGYYYARPLEAEAMRLRLGQERLPRPEPHAHGS
ncbi:hypothetical protein C4K68_21480 [Pokkaliibacter plantistimulans]|uniref:GGDEF-domain containing protein n=1 Tax=Proteobacteria bacterium 228 TaxID=2083153 RepID=A0A2S5KKP9_9PROT|nr:EAL domain-containing protein [Pokkaliibacter plantistimulans]PPC75213.1 hypothetical protein C4K68_21480 [Pokkaliibacter plantistimulans]